MKIDSVTQKKSAFKKNARVLVICNLCAYVAVVLFLLHVFAHNPIDEKLTSALKGAGVDRTTALAIESLYSESRERTAFKALAAVTLLFLAAAVFPVLVIRGIYRRLDAMAESAARAAMGELDETVRAEPYDEIGAIGQSINDFSANLQEVLLLLWNHTQTCLSKLNSSRAERGSNPPSLAELEEKLQCVRQELEDMRSMIRSFDFYNVRLEDGKLEIFQKEAEKIQNS